jgi:HSP20 family protein
MSDSKQMKNRDEQQVQSRSEPDTFLRPAVDIYEDAEGITLKADLPGVSGDRLDIRVDGKTLSIDARASIDTPEDMEALYADLTASRFRRDFTLSNELETDQIRAEMKDGVLTLRVPKRAELQPRKIEVVSA